MKLWVAYIVGCFVVAVLTWNMRTRTRIQILIAMIIGVMIGYYFFKQI